MWRRGEVVSSRTGERFEKLLENVLTAKPTYRASIMGFYLRRNILQPITENAHSWPIKSRTNRGLACVGFPALGANSMLSHSWHPLLVLTAHDNGHTFSRAFGRQLHDFPPLAAGTSFPTLGNGFMCFPALNSGYMFSRVLHRPHTFLAPAACFPRLTRAIGCF